MVGQISKEIAFDVPMRKHLELKMINSILPKGTRWIMGNHDLPQNYGMARFKLKDPQGHSNVISLSKRMRQVWEALAKSPLYCASTIRVGHYVDVLRDDHGVNIDTLWFTDDKGPIKTRFGVYVLRDDVALITEVAA